MPRNRFLPAPTIHRINLVGRMDEFALFNRALDSAEVAALSQL